MSDLDPSIAWKAIVDPRERAAAMPDLDAINELAEFARYTGDEVNYDVHGAERFYKAQEFVHVLQTELLNRLNGLRQVADASARVQRAVLDMAAKADAVVERHDLNDFTMYISSLTGELHAAHEELARATLAYMGKS